MGAYIGVQLPHKAGEVVVLEVLWQDVPGKFGWFPHDEAANGITRRQLVQLFATGDTPRVAGGMLWRAQRQRYRGAVGHVRGTDLLPCWPHEIMASVSGSETKSYLQEPSAQLPFPNLRPATGARRDRVQTGLSDIGIEKRPLRSGFSRSGERLIEPCWKVWWDGKPGSERGAHVLRRKGAG